MSARISTIVGVVIFVFLFLFSPVFAADVVINEFQVEPSGASQWVELYNKGSSSQDISGWIIDDNGGSEKFIIPSETVLVANAFISFESGKFNWNTSSEDSARLLQGDTIIDQYDFVISPGSGISFGRFPDGEAWGTCTPSTKGVANTNCLFPTPTPTNTPIPTPTSTPTKTPTTVPTVALASTNTPVPTKTPTPTASNTVSPTVKPSITPTSMATPTIEVISTVAASPTGVVLGDQDTQTPNNKPYIIALLFISVGCALLAAVFVIKNRVYLKK